MVENLNDRQPSNRYLLSENKEGSISLVMEGDLYGEIRYLIVTERIEAETACAMRFLNRELSFPDSYNAVDADELACFDKEIEEIPGWQGWLIIKLLSFSPRSKRGK